MEFCDKCGKLLKSHEEDWCIKCDEEAEYPVLELEDGETDT